MNKSQCISWSDAITYIFKREHLPLSPLFTLWLFHFISLYAFIFIVSAAFSVNQFTWALLFLFFLPSSTWALSVRHVRHWFKWWRRSVKRFFPFTCATHCILSSWDTENKDGRSSLHILRHSVHRIDSVEEYITCKRSLSREMAFLFECSETLSPAIVSQIWIVM